MVDPLPFSLPRSWMRHLFSELKKPYVAELAAFLSKEYAASPNSIFPPRDELFSSLILTPFENVKVVIMGQDPYHGEGQAHGLSFSVKPGVKTPPSLQNVYKELHSDLGIPPPSSGRLIPWAKEGVLLLNATLSVRKGAPLSHHNRGWERFTDAIVRVLLEERKHLVFLLWGKNAREKCLRFPESLLEDHLILEASHPSPYSAQQGFFGCRHFSKANAYLEQHAVSPVCWKLG